jgi:hypothetical protein
LLPTIAGDAIQIDWEALNGGVTLNLLPAGTTDFNFPQATPLTSGGLSAANNKGELKYQAAGAGNVPVEFIVRDGGGGSCGRVFQAPGPYNFTLLVTHALNLALPNVGTLRPAGALTVAVHNPEGGPINDPAVRVEVQIKGRGSWYTIGVAGVTTSAAVVPFKIPRRLRHQHVTLRALANGVGYGPASSSHLKVRTR